MKEKKCVRTLISKIKKVTSIFEKFCSCQKPNGKKVSRFQQKSELARKFANYENRMLQALCPSLVNFDASGIMWLMATVIKFSFPVWNARYFFLSMGVRGGGQEGVGLDSPSFLRAWPGPDHLGRREVERID